MSKKPIDLMMDAVEWIAADPTIEHAPDAVYATHEGILRIEDFEFRCYQLNTGERVLHAEDIERFFSAQH